LRTEGEPALVIETQRAIRIACGLANQGFPIDDFQFILLQTGILMASGHYHAKTQTHFGYNVFQSFVNFKHSRLESLNCHDLLFNTRGEFVGENHCIIAGGPHRW
jgi:hypothetical protein